MENNIILHIPHTGTKIPSIYMHEYVIDSSELEYCNNVLGDLYLDTITENINVDKVIFEYSRLFCDVERFRNNKLEPMSKIGMGVVYTRNHDLKTIRETSNEELIKRDYYDKYHEVLTGLVNTKLDKHEKCVILDLHSYSEERLPYEYVSGSNRPDFCIGFSDFHCDKDKVNNIKRFLIDLGFSVLFNDPFDGSIVPIEHFLKNSNVESYMIEINKRVYLNGFDMKQNDLEFIIKKIIHMIK